MPLLSPAEAARLLSISERHLRALTAAGTIRYINVGLGDKRETRRYDPEDIASFIQAKASQAERIKQTSHPPATVIDASDFEARLDARKRTKRKP